MENIVLTLKDGGVILGNINIDVSGLNPMAIVAKTMSYIIEEGYIEFNIILNYWSCAGYDEFMAVMNNNIIEKIERIK